MRTSPRISSIDAFRAWAVIGIIVLHIFDPPPDLYGLRVMVALPLRTAVPFFFAVSGFLYARGLRGGRSPAVQFKRTMTRLVPLYLVWCVVYFINPPFGAILEQGVLAVYHARFVEALQNWERILLVGPAFHLWFFNALISAVVLFHLLGAYRRLRFALVVAIGLYTVGVLGGPYAQLPIGLHLPVHTRHFVFFSFLPFVLGFALHEYETRSVAVGTGLAIWSAGMIGMAGETWLLDKLGAAAPHAVEYTFSTVLMGVGVLWMARSRSRALTSAPLASLGRLAPGLYASHILIALRLHWIEDFFDPRVWMVVAPVLTFVGALAVTWVLSKWSFTRRWVT
ncbi:MAG: acyltransferase [Verrucomicrobia bacterium]|nr:acyltransferase [Verrucomicrobiota bacterium]